MILDNFVSQMIFIKFFVKIFEKMFLMRDDLSQ